MITKKKMHFFFFKLIYLKKIVFFGPIKIWNYPTFPVLELHNFYQKSPVQGGYLELDTRTEEG